jgi:hypothetical protein
MVHLPGVAIPATAGNQAFRTGFGQGAAWRKSFKGWTSEFTTIVTKLDVYVAAL